MAETRRRLEVLTFLVLTTGVFDRAAELDPAIVRALDAVHLAAATCGPAHDGRLSTLCADV